MTAKEQQQLGKTLWKPHEPFSLLDIPADTDPDTAAGEVEKSAFRGRFPERT